MENRKQKKVEDSFTEQVQMVMTKDINGNDRLFGGRLMEWLDIVAGIVARRHCERDVITAAVDNLQFKQGAYLNEILVLIGKVSYVGKTSMEVRIDTYVENAKGERKPINRAYFVMVAMNTQGKPVPIPELERTSLAEELEWESGKRRYELRKSRRMEGY